MLRLPSSRCAAAVRQRCIYIACMLHAHVHPCAHSCPKQLDAPPGSTDVQWLCASWRGPQCWCTSAAGRPAVQLLHHRAPCPRHCCRRR